MMSKELTKYQERSEINCEEVPTIEKLEADLSSKADLFSYQVPKLAPDGSCSAEKGGLEEDPYDLRAILGVQNSEQEEIVKAQIVELYNLLEGIQQELKTDWIGIYQATANVEGNPVLVKLAYQGTPSRAEFPLAEEFAPLSNNTTVGLSGKAIVIQSVAQYQGAYYKCDGSVNSEACLPIYNKDFTKVIGIIDAEDFDENHFDERNVSLLAQLCIQLSDYLPIKF